MENITKFHNILIYSLYAGFLAISQWRNKIFVVTCVSLILFTVLIEMLQAFNVKSKISSAIYAFLFDLPAQVY